MAKDVEDIVAGVLGGDRRAASRLMRLVDDHEEASIDLLGRLYPHTGRALVVGVAGSPGCGKSTIIDGLLAELRGQGRKVGVVAIDPSSALTGGAILGDRIRMQRHSLDEGVFIRSLATRGAQGGLSRSTLDVCRVMDAMGMDVVVVETVGIGQDEVDIRMAANVTVVVLSPDTGDAIQIMKAGVMEIADVFVVNKMDKDGGDAVVQELRLMLASTPERAGTPVVEMEARSGRGARELAGTLGAFVEPPGRIREKRRLEIRRRAGEAFAAWFEERSRESIERTIDRIQDGAETPYDIVRRIKGSMEGWSL